MQTPKGFLIVILLPLLVFFLYELYLFLRALLTLKAKKQEAVLTAEQEEEIKRKAIEEYLQKQKEADESKEETNTSAEDTEQ
jgi:signal peptidase